MVLHHEGPGLVFLEPDWIFAAMLGDIGIEIPFSYPEGLQLESGRSVFTTGGKMLRYGADGTPIAPQNTTINAVIVVEHYPHGQKRFGRHVMDLAKRRGYSSEKLPLNEWAEEMEGARGTERDVSLEAIRVVVHENPYARVPLPSGVFLGPFDERYGMTEEGFISRVFAGSEIIGLDDPPTL